MILTALFKLNTASILIRVKQIINPSPTNILLYISAFELRFTNSFDLRMSSIFLFESTLTWMKFAKVKPIRVNENRIDII